MLWETETETKEKGFQMNKAIIDGGCINIAAETEIIDTLWSIFEGIILKESIFAFVGDASKRVQ